jgi:hypothetical protein
MANKPFSFPQQWEDWASWMLGLWLLLSPWALFFDQETIALENALAVGALVIIAEIVELSIFRGWEEWINIALGAWLFLSPWVLGITSAAARWNFVVVGALVVALALYELKEMAAGSPNSGPRPG